MLLWLCLAGAVVLPLAQTVAVPAALPQAPADAAAVLQRMETSWQGLASYQVPVTISGRVRAHILALPIHMSGTEYYQAPDKQILVIRDAPRIARGLGDTISTMGSPPTWSRDYDLKLTGSQPHQHHGSYVLEGPPKRESRVKSVTISVSATTYAVESITFAYTNGAKLAITLQHHRGLTQYHLPRSTTLTATFPAYSGDATLTYGDYQVNQPIAPTVFAPQH